jgi:nucleoside-diphosphate-sugar epimerase
VLLTGRAGFTGSYVAEHLLHSGHEIAFDDHLMTGRRENIPKGAEFYEADIRPGCAEILRDFKPEVTGVDTSVNRLYGLLLVYCPPPRFSSGMVNQ